MRRAISKILRKTEKKLETHKALLKLGSSNGVLRLVTTNFDRLFHEASQALEQEFREHNAPTLPRATNEKWNGLVFLHGVLPQNDEKDEDKEALNRLVVTSGDFGLAYL